MKRVKSAPSRAKAKSAKSMKNVQQAKGKPIQSKSFQGRPPEVMPKVVQGTAPLSILPQIPIQQPGISIIDQLEEIFKPVRELIAFEKKMVKAYELCLDPPDVSVGTTPHEVVWEEDGIRLLHYLPFVEKEDVKLVPLVFVYALINRPYILDLQPDRSVVRQFLRQGIDCYLIDWGTPVEADKYRDTNDYINYYIDSIVDYISERHGLDKISILGYCMGGTYSVLYTALHPDRVKNLIVMAAGIDWASEAGLLRKWSNPEHFHIDKIVDTYGNVSGNFLNSAFSLLNPIVNNYSKYLDLIAKVDDEMFIANFLRMEKWIRDGIPLAGEAYREFIKNGYQGNKLVKGEWIVGNRAANLKDIDMPVLNLIGEKDTLIHPEESQPLLDNISSTDKSCITFPTGHIGISVGSKLHRDVWPKVVKWLVDRSDKEQAGVVTRGKIGSEKKGDIIENKKKNKKALMPVEITEPGKVKHMRKIMKPAPATPTPTKEKTTIVKKTVKKKRRV